MRVFKYPFRVNQTTPMDSGLAYCLSLSCRARERGDTATLTRCELLTMKSVFIEKDIGGIMILLQELRGLGCRFFGYAIYMKAARCLGRKQKLRGRSHEILKAIENQGGL